MRKWKVFDLLTWIVKWYFIQYESFLHHWFSFFEVKYFVMHKYQLQILFLYLFVSTHVSIPIVVLCPCLCFVCLGFLPVKWDFSYEWGNTHMANTQKDLHKAAGTLRKSKPNRMSLKIIYSSLWFWNPMKIKKFLWVLA